MANISPPALIFKPILLLAKANIDLYCNLTNIAAVFTNVGLAFPCTTSVHNNCKRLRCCQGRGLTMLAAVQHLHALVEGM